MNPLSDTHIHALTRLAGEKNIRFGEISQTFEPGIHAQNLDADIMVSPTCTDDLQAIIKYCSAHSVAIVPHGGRTGISGAAVSSPGQLIVSTSKLNQILELDFIAGVAVVEAGVSLQQLQEAIAPHGYGAGIDLAARGTATIGGMISTNAGGTEAFRNGVMRHRVLGLEVVLPNGEILGDLKQVIKANEGYDVKQLFIGAEGTLGVVTKIVLSLLPATDLRSTALVSCENTLSATNLYRELRQELGDNLVCIEIMWPDYALTTANVLGLENLLEFAHSDTDVFVILDVSIKNPDEGNENLEQILSDFLAKEMITSALIAQNEREAGDFWKIREESFLCDQKYPNGFWYDISVPLPHLEEYTNQLFKRVSEIDIRLKVFLFGHLGDGNLHLTVSSGEACAELTDAIDHAVYQGLTEMGGSFSAEHGIGNEKIKSLSKYCDENKLKLLKSIKNMLDPAGIMNPGKVLD